MTDIGLAAVGIVAVSGGSSLVALIRAYLHDLRRHLSRKVR